MRAYRRLLLNYSEACVEYEKNRWQYWHHPRWLPIVVEPLAKKLLRFFPGYTAEALGPFGLGSKVSMVFRNGGDRKSIVVSPRHEWSCIPHICIGVNFAWVNESEDTKSYQPGTVGWLNGFNNPEILISKDVSLSWFKERVR